MNIAPIAFFRSPFKTKFGVPRQSSLAESVEGEVVFEPGYRDANAVRGLEDFDYIWLLWEFSLNEGWSPTVRPPRLGGNSAVGVFASRSPFRPNRIGISSVRLAGIEITPDNGPVLHVRGADLVDGTPIFDIKPYVPYSDSHPGARAGFVGSVEWDRLKVEFTKKAVEDLGSESDALMHPIKEFLSLDPRPQYQDDPDRVYGVLFGGRDIRFRVRNGVLTVISAPTVD